MKLTATKIKSLRDGKHADGRGLTLKVRGNSRSWIYRTTVDGKRVEMSIGTYPAFTLADARMTRDKMAATIARGRDPRDVKRKMGIASATIADLIALAFEARRSDLKADGASGRWMSPLANHVLPRLGDRTATSVDQNDIVEALRPIWREKAPTAKKALGRLDIALRHGLAMGLNVDPTVIAKAKIILGAQGYVVKNIPSMPYDQVPVFYASLGDRTSELALKLLILTAVRTNPVRKATVNQFDLDAKIWTIPAALMKSRKGKGSDFRVPLSDEAVAVVRQAMLTSGDGPDAILFRGLRGIPLSDHTMANQMLYRGMDYRPHGFRSSFRDWATENEKDWVTTEMSLAHSIGSAASRAYQRTDSLKGRAVLMGAWAEFVKPRAIEDLRAAE